MEPFLLMMAGVWITVESTRKALVRWGRRGAKSPTTRAAIAWTIFGIGFIFIGAAGGEVERAGVLACGIALLSITTVPCRYAFWNRPGWHALRNLLFAAAGVGTIAYGLLR